MVCRSRPEDQFSCNLGKNPTRNNSSTEAKNDSFSIASPKQIEPFALIMAFYLVEGIPREDRLEELKQQLADDAFVDLRPFGQALSKSLRNARRRPDGLIVWEEEDYCSPPLAEERTAVLNDYFESVTVEQVPRGEGWARIQDLPPLFPDLAKEGPAISDRKPPQ